jgi:hypothetical protein
LEVWKFGSLEVWKFGSLEVWKFGSLEVFSGRPVIMRDSCILDFILPNLSTSGVKY